MSLALHTFRSALLALAGGLLLCGTLHAQSRVLRGRVLDPGGGPVADQVVAVHRVVGADGGEVGRATTDEDGRFELELEPGSGGGIYFAATRFEDKLYMGPPFRSLGEVGDDYVIVVGVNPIGGFTSPGAAAPTSGPPDGAMNGPVLAILGVVGVLGLVLVLRPLLPQERRRHATRTLLLELAALEERRAQASPEEAEALAARAERIRARLRAPNSSAV